MCVGKPGLDLVGKHRAGLDFSFVSFLCIKTKKRKEARVITFMHFLLLVQKKEIATMDQCPTILTISTAELTSGPEFITAAT